MEVIEHLLRASLLGELGADEDRVGKIRSAAQDLATALSYDKRNLLPHALLVAVDESGGPDAPALELAEEHLLEHWVTFRNVFPQRPLEVLRAVLLEAVAQAADADTETAHGATYVLRASGRGLSPGRWAAVVAELATRWDGITQDAVRRYWATPPTSGFRMPAVASDIKIALKSDLVGRAKTAANVEAYNFNQFSQHLQGEFEGFVQDLVNFSAAAAQAAADTTNAQVKDAFEKLGVKLRDALGGTITTTRLRTDLLWWRESSYSERLRARYRDLAPAAAVIATAADLHDLVPSVAPEATEHLLADLVAALPAGDTGVTLEEIASAEGASGLPHNGEALSPGLLLDVIGSGQGVAIAMRPDEAIPASLAAVLLFRELQAVRLLQARSAPEAD